MGKNREPDTADIVKPKSEKRDKKNGIGKLAGQNRARLASADSASLVGASRSAEWVSRAVLDSCQ